MANASYGGRGNPQKGKKAVKIEREEAVGQSIIKCKNYRARGRKPDFSFKCGVEWRIRKIKKGASTSTEGGGRTR